MTHQPLFAIKYKDGRISSTSTAEQLFEAIQKLLPATEIYSVTPDPDGKGFSYREVGTLVVDFQATGSTDSVQAPAPVQPPTPPPSPITPAPLSSPDQYVFTPDVPAPKPQPTPPSKPKRGRKPKEAHISNDPNDTSWEADLPKPVVTERGTMQVTGIYEASPQQAAMASHFGKNW